MGIGERIKSLYGPREKRKFAQSVGYSVSYISHIENGIRKPSRAILEAISKKYNVSIDWLLTGKGRKELSPLTVKKAEVIYEPTANIIIASNTEYKKLLQDQPGVEAYIPIPLISEHVAAGDALIIDEKDIKGFAIIYKAWIKRGHIYRCLQVRGNSMHPVISDGFIVAIDLNENDPLKLERQILAARHEDGVTIRYLILTEKEYILLPHNTADFKPIVISRTAPNPIIGKVVWWWGKAK